MFRLCPEALGVMVKEPSFPESSVSARAQVLGYPLCAQSKMPVLGVDEQESSDCELVCVAEGVLEQGSGFICGLQAEVSRLRASGQGAWAGRNRSSLDNPASTQIHT